VPVDAPVQFCVPSENKTVAASVVSWNAHPEVLEKHLTATGA
jgi:hypothetical protein